MDSTFSLYSLNLSNLGRASFHPSADSIYPSLIDFSNTSFPHVYNPSCNSLKAFSILYASSRGIPSF
jgi:hypothetical protein